MGWIKQAILSSIGKKCLMAMSGSLLGLFLLVPFGSGCSGNGDGEACTANVDCADDQRCVADTCEAVICEPGCTTDFECKHGSCACTSDVACDAGEVCDLTAGACVLDTTPPECTSDTGCDTGQICVNTVCEASPTCAADGDCPGDGAMNGRARLFAYPRIVTSSLYHS